MLEARAAKSKTGRQKKKKKPSCDVICILMSLYTTLIHFALVLPRFVKLLSLEATCTLQTGKRPYSHLFLRPN